MKRSSINYNRQYLHGPRAWKASTHRSGEKPQIAFAASIAAAVLAVGSLVLYDAYLCIAVIPEPWGLLCGLFRHSLAHGFGNFTERKMSNAWTNSQSMAAGRSRRSFK